MILSALGSLVLAAITWFFAGGAAAFGVVVWSGIALAVIAFWSKYRFKFAIRKALAGVGSVR